MVAGIMDDSNKASIDAMWENRTILRMKYWNGWQFKYVAIESYVPSKQGEVTDFYEATLNLTEVPIMTMRKGGDFRIPKMSALASILLSGKSKLSSTVISEFLDKLENGKILGK